MTDLHLALRRLKSRKAPGPDRVGADLYKLRPFAMRRLLLEYFNACFLSASTPDRWKIARVVMIVKGGSKNSRLPFSHRPISLANSIYKVYAALLQSRLALHFDHRISDFQYGFRARRSTSAPLFTIRRMVELFERHTRSLYILWVQNCFWYFFFYSFVFFFWVSCLFNFSMVFFNFSIVFFNISIVFFNCSMVFFNFPWFSSIFHCFLQVFHGVLQFSIVFFNFSIVFFNFSMVFHGFLQVFHGFLQFSIVFFNCSMVFCNFTWFSASFLWFSSINQSIYIYICMYVCMCVCMYVCM